MSQSVLRLVATRRSRQAAGARSGAGPDRPGVRQGLGDEAGRRAARWSRSSSSPPARSGWTWRWASAACRAGASSRSIGPESSGKTTLALHIVAEVQKGGRHRRLHRRRARARPRLRPEAGREPRRPAGVPARHRRAGAGDHRHPGALGRGGRDRDQLGGGADARGRDRGRDGRQPARPAGAPDEPGAAQADRLDLQVQDPGHLHQPDPHEDRGDVRQPRDHHRRQRAEVLRLGPPRHPPHRLGQERATRSSATTSA